ncbi:MAG TPA: GGDEF domain-containing protein [Candidatus Sulfotelmatobacter sp.]|nr:GGDEF domain-containing protein [Candidatus Sulfotelmatobacter sp.]
MFRPRAIVITAITLWVVHVCLLLTVGSRSFGPILSDVLQAVIGGLLVICLVHTARRSEGMARAFWHLGTVAYVLWMIAQGLSVANDMHPMEPAQWIMNLLFSFWFAPLAMALFLDPDHEAGRVDALLALDFVQGVLVCVAAYLYFFYIPKVESGGELAHTVWAPYFGGYGLVSTAFVLRGILTHSRDVRRLFGTMGAFLAMSGCVDALYYYGPGQGLKTGQWFDALWSALLVIPMLIAASWNQDEAPEATADPKPAEKRIYTELFYLIYPMAVLLMSLRIAVEHLTLAGLVVGMSFVCSSARLLVTQNRLLNAKEALRREASRDSLTGLWNHKVILNILDRELVRAERDQQAVGVIMIDVDHFKAINDTRGHAAGDVVLRIIASGIAAMVRPYDSVGRYGGEEFLIIAPGCGLGETWELAERVRTHVASCSIMAGGSHVKVSLSLGVTTGQKAADLEKVLNASDSAMYQAKRAGRNRVEPSLEKAAGAGRGSASSAEHDFWI